MVKQISLKVVWLCILFSRVSVSLSGNELFALEMLTRERRTRLLTYNVPSNGDKTGFELLSSYIETAVIINKDLMKYTQKSSSVKHAIKFNCAVSKNSLLSFTAERTTMQFPSLKVFPYPRFFSGAKLLGSLFGITGQMRLPELKNFNITLGLLYHCSQLQSIDISDWQNKTLTSKIILQYPFNRSKIGVIIMKNLCLIPSESLFGNSEYFQIDYSANSGNFFWRISSGIGKEFNDDLFFQAELAGGYRQNSLELGWGVFQRRIENFSTANRFGWSLHCITGSNRWKFFIQSKMFFCALDWLDKHITGSRTLQITGGLSYQ